MEEEKRVSKYRPEAILVSVLVGIIACSVGYTHGYGEGITDQRQIDSLKLSIASKKKSIDSLDCLNELRKQVDWEVEELILRDTVYEPAEIKEPVIYLREHQKQIK